jgi:LCP family protein required for cell wall assembly
MPGDWFREPSPRSAPRPAGPAAPGPSGPADGLPSGSGYRDPGYRDPGGAWPEQPPLRAGGRGKPSRPPASGGGYSGRGPTGGRRWLRPRRILGIIALLIVVVLLVTTGLYFYLNSQLHRANVLVDYAGRPAASAGTNWLITGSDSRQGLTRKEERQLATGRDIGGRRSDTTMILHIPGNGGRPTLVSLPRDSYLPIPGYGTNKLNAAYSFGGPKLLAETVQNATGLHIDHYMGIGFGGFVNVVDAVGGVRMCLPGPMNDPKAGLHLKAGCQVLNGKQALGFVRTRNFAISDLQREQDQRLFVKALLSKVTSLGTIINPFAVFPAASGAAGSVTVDSGTSLYQLVQVAFALKNPVTTTVPIANAGLATSAGSAVEWNSAEAHQLFSDLNADRKVPRSLITGSKGAATA